MADPVRIADALVSLALPTNDPTEAFAAEWARWVDDDGHPLTLPAGWRAKVHELAAWGLDAGQAESCVAKAMTADLRSDARRFGYALAVGRDAARRADAISATLADPEARRGEFVVNTTNGIVHRSTCRTLVMTSPLNVAPVAHDEPFKRCRVCLG